MRAPPLLIGAAAGLVAALLMAPFTGTALGQLHAARRSHAALVAQTARPAPAVPLVARELALGAGDEAEGRGAIVARVHTLAKAGGVLVEETSAVAAPPGIAALRIRVSGAEKAVLALADTLERGQPLLRLRSWRVEPIAGGVRLIGEVVAAWR